MATYLMQVQYSSAAFKGMLTDPSDRGEAVKKLAQAFGTKVLGVYYSVSRAGIVILAEGKAEDVSAISMIAGASGVLESIDITELISTDSMNQVMASAAKLSGSYKAPN